MNVGVSFSRTSGELLWGQLHLIYEGSKSKDYDSQYGAWIEEANDFFYSSSTQSGMS